MGFATRRAAGQNVAQTSRRQDGQRYRARRPVDPQAGRLRHPFSMALRSWDSRAESSSLLGTSYAYISHWVGGIAT